ncbi:hypothetical protein [Caballeronia sp. ATUFL_M2_KS44]|uniref:hypothetical protein n=1 Tax=Caballeronia sp. ATUFL_M2_KS44 TaxID=2921767 RepID=UPI002029273F|nr:hypothetical protein [Caballeronia sp. ATUFL_M2_KS44]
MNVTSPLATHKAQPSASTLPIKRNNETTTGESPAKSQTTPSNPPHLGNSIDTTA